MNSKKRYMVIALLALLVVSAMAYNDEAKPWTFWNWKYGSVSKPGIHAELTGIQLRRGEKALQRIAHEGAGMRRAGLG